MQNRTAKFASAIFASLLAGTPLTTVSHGAAPAADDCLAGPKGQAPQGSHWYYRVDRPSKRHCWYLGEEREKLSRVAPQKSAPIANPVSAEKNAVSADEETAPQRPIADAHAELPLPQTRVEQQTSAPAWQRSPAITANAASVENSQAANARDANTHLSVIASRWPEPSGVSSSASPAPTTSNSDEAGQSNSEAAPPPAVAAVTLAAGSSSEKQPGSLPMLLVVMMGALVLAGVMGSAIFRFGSMRQAGRRQTRGDRRAIWDSIDSDRPWPPAHPSADISMRRVDIPREPREADDPNDRIAEMLARLSKSAAT
jgi:hypothetical protein